MYNYILKPIYDNAKSFYGKAQVRSWTDENGIKIDELMSYNTLVSRVRTTENSIGMAISRDVEVFGTYDKKAAACAKVWNSTTLRHVKEFLRQRDIRARTWGDVEKYVVKDDYAEYAKAHDEGRYYPDPRD